MTINDPELAEIVKRGLAVEIDNRQYTVHQQRSGSCDGCAFESERRCPSIARQYCCSNGGNILKLVEHKS